jgi:hypothetical protein
MLACAGTADAGITLGGGTYKGVGDPKARYDFFAYLDVGSKLVKGTTFDKDDFFTLDKLFGIKGPADFTFKIGGHNQPWGAAFSAISHPDLKIGSTDYGKVAATDVTFFYEGPAIDNSHGTTAILLGEVKISEDDYHRMPVLPSGTQIPITYDYKTKDSHGTRSLSFTVVPEPSSFVIVTVVGSCVTGLALLRRSHHAV